MEERQVTVDGESYPLNMPFIVIATQNLIETAGTYQLPEAQLDRFLLKISMGYPDKQEELAILNRFKGSNPFDTLKNVCDGQDIQKMCAEAKNVFVHESIMNYIIDIVVKTREHENIAIGVSPRGTLNMVNAVRAYAYIKGRQYVTPEDVKKLAVSVFAHRLVLKHGMTRQDNRQTIIKDILDTVVVPTEDWLK